jgi:hypothetical protein
MQLQEYPVAIDFLGRTRQESIYAGAFERENSTGFAITKGFKGLAAREACTEADIDMDGMISLHELKESISLWQRGEKGISSLMTFIKRWKAGC